MSDTYYRQEAARRQTRWLIAAVAFALLGATVLGIHTLFYDACTQSYARAPLDVVVAYNAALNRGDVYAAQECWEHQVYYNLEAGCSEICLERFAGAAFDVVEATASNPQHLEGRAVVQVAVTIVCANGEQHSAGLTLDGVGAALPWRHWAIVRSTLGGTIAEPWCKQP